MQNPAIIRTVSCNRCGDIGLEHGGVDLYGRNYCERCFDRIEMDDQIDDAWSNCHAHDAKEFREGR